MRDKDLNQEDHEEIIGEDFTAGESNLENEITYRKYRKPARKINLDNYVKNVIEKYKETLKKNRKQLKLQVGQKYISLNNKKLINIYVNRGLYDYTGIIYRIIEIGSGKMLYGLTTDPISIRWQNYKDLAEKHRYYKYKLTIEQAILNTIDRNIDPDSIFIIKPVEICFDLNTLRKRERYWVKRHNTTNPRTGYNSNKGGGGGPKASLPMIVIAKYIAYGYNIKKITTLLNKVHGIIIDRRTVSRRIVEYWKSKLNSQKAFLKPVLIQLIKDGYNTNDISEAYGSAGRNIIERYIPRLFNGMNFSQVRRRILIEIIKDLIIEGLGQEAMDKKFERFGWREIDNTIKEKWESLYNAQKLLWKPIIIKKLKAGWEGPEILMSLGYAKSTAYSKHNQIMKRLFGGMNTKQLKEFYLNN